jgi:glycosyltransferase involved in cell wall biosynthesis
MGEVSVIIPTINSAKYISFLINSIIGKVEEIIIGVDNKTTDTTFSVLNNYKIQIIFFDNKQNNVEASKTREILAQHATKDWILFLDDDEFISTRFFIYKDCVLHKIKENILAFPRKWVNLVQHNLVYLNKKPIYPDFQYRLVRRNNIIFQNKIHNPPIKLIGKIRYLKQIPIYHLDWLLKTYDERLKKVEGYEKYGKNLGCRYFYLWEDFYNFNDKWKKIKHDLPLDLIKSLTNLGILKF